MQLPMTLRALTSSPTARRLFSITVWSAIAEGASKGLLLVSMVLVARILGKEGFGEFGIVRTTINLFATLSGAGLGLTANRYVAQYRDVDKRHAGEIIGSSYLLAAGFGIAVAGCLIAASDFLAREVLEAPQLADALRIAGVLVFLSAIGGAQAGILQGFEAYRRYALGGVVQGVVGLAAFVAGAYYRGVEGALAGFVLYMVTGVVALHLLIRREVAERAIRVAYRSLRNVMPTFWAFSVPAALMGLAVAPFKWVTETSLATGAGYRELGLFHAALTVSSISLALVITLNAPLITLMANRQESIPSPRIRYLSLYAGWYVFFVLALPCVVFPRLPSLLFGPGFDTSVFHTVTLLLLLYSGLQTYYQGIMRLVTQHGSMWFGLTTNLCEGVTLLVAFFALAQWGAIGLGAAYISSYVVRVLVSTPYLVRQGIVPAPLLFDKYFAATLGAFTVLVLLQVVRLQ